MNLSKRIDSAYSQWILTEQDWRRQEPEEPVIVDPNNIEDINSALHVCRGPCVGREAYEAGQDYQPPMYWTSDVPIGPPDDMGNPYSKKYGGVRPWTENEVMSGLMDKRTGRLMKIAMKSPVMAAYRRNYGSYSEESVDEAIQLGATNAWRALKQDEGRLGTRFDSYIGTAAEEGMRTVVPPGFKNEFRVARGLLGRFEDISKRILRSVRDGKPVDGASLAQLQRYIGGIDPQPGPNNKSKVPVAALSDQGEEGQKVRGGEEMKDASLGILAPIVLEVGQKILRAASDANEQALEAAVAFTLQKFDEVREKEEIYTSHGPNMGNIITHPKESVPSAANLAKMLPRQMEYPISMGELADRTARLKTSAISKRLFEKATARIREYPTTISSVRSALSARPDKGRGTDKELEILDSSKQDLSINNPEELADIIERLAAANANDRELDILRAADPDAMLKNPGDLVAQLSKARESYIKNLRSDPTRNIKPIMVQSKEGDRESERAGVSSGSMRQMSAGEQTRTLAYREIMKKAVRAMRSGRGSGKGWEAKLANDAITKVEKAIAVSRDWKPPQEYSIKRQQGDQPNYDIIDAAGNVAASGFDSESEAAQRIEELSRNPALPTIKSVMDGISPEYGEYADELRDICKHLAYSIKNGDEDGVQESEEELNELKQVAAEDITKFKAKPEVGSTLSQQAYRVYIRLLGMGDYPEKGTVEDPEIDPNTGLSEWAKSGYPALIVPDIAKEFGVSVQRIKQLKEKAEEVIEPIARKMQMEAVDDFDKRLIYEARVRNAQSFLRSKLEGHPVLEEYKWTHCIVD